MEETLSTPNALGNLPQDCWVQILDLLSPSDIASIVATSRDLQISSQRSLYHRIDIDWTRPPLKRVLTLFRDIYKRPDLAIYIHHVSMISSKLVYPEVGREDEWALPQIDGDWNQLSSLFQDEEWIHALEHGDPYAFVAILISQLHNLRSLQLDYSFVWETGFSGLMIKHARLSASENTLSRFSQLPIVEYGMNVPDPGSLNKTRWKLMDAFPVCDPDQFEGWFYLP
ncbi:hypothetical protein PITC_026670 [Penicillium italicum]|uniref:F-box domain-containing protein n=1 Tax=Penicillium italicum TaxID=40296 RepID=A0A0A2KVT7_PENIT|nr:hypothetical protein PITC_026670 [Penicillium italicum]